MDYHISALDSVHAHFGIDDDKARAVNAQRAAERVRYQWLSAGHPLLAGRHEANDPAHHRLN
jgi:hypothetical protein